MPFGPILRALTRSRARFVLIVAEVALTLAIVANCVSLIRESKASLAEESGFDDAQLVSIRSRPFAEAFREEKHVNAVIDADVRALKAMPGVLAASNTGFLPWAGGGSSTEVRLPGSEQRYRTQVYGVDPDIFKTLGVEVVRGRNFTRVEYETEHVDGDLYPAIVTEALSKLLYPEGDALGKTLQNGEAVDEYRVVGVFDPFHNPYGWPIDDYAIFFPGRSGFFGSVRLLVRTELGQTQALIPEIERTLLRIDGGRNVELMTIAEVRERYDTRDRTVVAALNSVMLLLIAVTALGIVGITAFSVAERQRQIGTRRALGATRGAILGHFLLENWIVTTCGALLGLALAYGLNFGLVTMVQGARIDGWILAAGVGLLWITGFGAALGPALKAARTAPAIATRNV